MFCSVIIMRLIHDGYKVKHLQGQCINMHVIHSIKEKYIGSRPYD